MKRPLFVEYLDFLLAINKKRRAGKPSSVNGRHLSGFSVTGKIISDLPADNRRGTHPLLDLAPDEVYPAAAVTGRPGELLPRHFTLTIVEWRYIFCGTGCRSSDSPELRPDVTRHHPLRSPDFPLVDTSGDPARLKDII